MMPISISTLLRVYRDLPATGQPAPQEEERSRISSPQPRFSALANRAMTTAFVTVVVAVAILICFTTLAW